MSWMQKLCEVYDAMAGTEGCTLLPIGFIQKKIKYDIILSADGSFVTAQQIPEEQQRCAVPSTPQAEGRSGTYIAPFPLADQLKYLLTETEEPRSTAYLAQLSDWCDAPDAPDCLRVLRGYLEKRTLLTDLMGVPGLAFAYPREQNSIACFSVQGAAGEERLWMRRDVRESWARRARALWDEGPTALCYATGERLPCLLTHQKLSGNAKLISGRDTGYPFQYKGRFTEDRSAVAVSASASLRAHSALRWLLDHQGFQRYGMHLVAWNTSAPALDPPEGLFDDEGQAERRADTFEPYARALRDATAGYMEPLRRFSGPDELTEETRRRKNEVVILGMQAATDGRMSITYYQELPGDLYVARLDAWAAACRWEMPGVEQRTVRTPTWREICETVLGRDAVQLARHDPKAEKAATKQMREMQLRLLRCIVDADALPRDFVQQAFRRAVQPARATDGSGRWMPFAWARCVAVACALIRKHRVDRGRAVPNVALDVAEDDRDYLYGRILAVAHKLELDARAERGRRTLALQLMPRLVQRPDDTWLHLYGRLLPYLKRLGTDGWRASAYQRLFGQIERRFRPEDRRAARPLSHLFLIGFSAQLRELYQKADRRQAEPELAPFAPPTERDALFGCLLAVADVCEWDAALSLGPDGRQRRSTKDGDTNAMRLTAAMLASPATAWMHVHDKLIAYLAKHGPQAARSAQWLLRRIERGFAAQERTSDAPLGGLFLNGYFGMRLALTTKDGLDRAAWSARPAADRPPDSRDAVYGALLALEDRVERWVLDREKTPEEDRLSNALRLLPRAAQRPDEVLAHLLGRMRPYQRKLGFPDRIERELARLSGLLETHGWDTAAPLGQGYLPAFYTYEPAPNDRKEG